MSDGAGSGGRAEEGSENLFKIIDGIIMQLNRTKRLFIIMILTAMIIPPLSFAIANALLDPPGGYGPPRLPPGVRDFLRQLPLMISIVWLGVGIGVWLNLSKWTKRYDRYKAMQEKIDRELAGGEESDEGEPPNRQNRP